MGLLEADKWCVTWYNKNKLFTLQILGYLVVQIEPPVDVWELLI